jgi:hypothetical protein
MSWWIATNGNGVRASRMAGSPPVSRSPVLSSISGFVEKAVSWLHRELRLLLPRVPGQQFGNHLHMQMFGVEWPLSPL